MVRTKTQKPDPTAVYSVWDPFSAELDGTTVTFPVGTRLLGSHEAVRRWPEYFALDGDPMTRQRSAQRSTLSRRSQTIAARPSSRRAPSGISRSMTSSSTPAKRIDASRRASASARMIRSFWRSPLRSAGRSMTMCTEALRPDGRSPRPGLSPSFGRAGGIRGVRVRLHVPGPGRGVGGSERSRASVPPLTDRRAGRGRCLGEGRRPSGTRPRSILGGSTIHLDKTRPRVVGGFDESSESPPPQASACPRAPC
jgi:hypothetical protein